MQHSTIVLLLALMASGCSNGPRYEQLFAGFNGPSNPKTTYFFDAQSVRTSWLSKALSPSELDRILSQVSFDEQMLVASAVGKRPTATGHVTIDDISQHNTSLSVYVLIGVNGDGCIEPHSAAYPFAVAVVEKPLQFDRLGGYFHQNFPDGCKPVKVGTPND